MSKDSLLTRNQSASSSNSLLKLLYTSLICFPVLYIYIYIYVFQFIYQTKYISFSRPHPRQKQDLLLIISDKTIYRTKYIQFLGVLIDDKFNWQYIVVSSANNIVLHISKQNGRTLIYIINIIGPTCDILLK